MVYEMLDASAHDSLACLASCSLISFVQLQGSGISDMVCSQNTIDVSYYRLG